MPGRGIVEDEEELYYADYKDESMLPEIQGLVSKDLSEPYSVFLYRYFLINWPSLCVCAYARPKGSSADVQGKMIATIVCKAEDESDCFRGYIAMLAVDSKHRKKGIALELATRGIDRMVLMGCDEVVLEAELTNIGAQALYEKLGFVRDERLGRYYLNGGDAFRLKLWIDKVPKEVTERLEEAAAEASHEEEHAKFDDSISIALHGHHQVEHRHDLLPPHHRPAGAHE